MQLEKEENFSDGRSNDKYYLDNDENFWTAMTYSDVLNLLTHINQSTVFVEFTDIYGHKRAVSPAHIVEVYDSQEQQGVNNGRD